MCSDNGNKQPSFRSAVSNWSNYDAPFATKLRLASRNFWVRVVRRQRCCGNHGQPGC